MPQAAVEGTRVNRSVIRLIVGDITDLEIDAFVFYAQEDLALGSGFGGAISVRGGPSIQKELEELGPVAQGDAVVSGAGKLKADHIIHAVGPRFQEEETEPKLRRTVLSSLVRANEAGIERLAFPAMGAGYYGIPPALCAKVMVAVLGDHLAGDTGLSEVVICVLDTTQYNAFQDALAVLE